MHCSCAVSNVGVECGGTSGKMFGKIICPVVATNIPENLEVLPDHAVLEPPQLHVPSLRFLVMHFLFDKGFRDLVVSLNRSGRLRMGKAVWAL